MKAVVRMIKEPVMLCNTIIKLEEARELITRDLTPKDGKIATFMEPTRLITRAIKEQVKILADYYGLYIEES